MNSSDGSIFDPEPVPEKQAGQARLLAMLFYSAIREKMCQHDVSRPFDP